MSNYTIYTENIKDIRRKRVLEVALNEVKKYDAGPNREVIYNDEFYGYHASGSNYHWCSVFVWWVFKELKVSYVFLYNKYLNNHILLNQIQIHTQCSYNHLNFHPSSDK